MGYLLGGGIVSLFFGLLLLVAPGLLGALGSTCNVVVLTLDGWLNRSKVWIGVLLLITGAWMLTVAIQYPGEWYITAAWIVAVAFGLLFLFFPGWLSWLSKVSNAFLFSADEMVSGARRTFGIVLIIVSVYIFYAALLAVR
ncbi:hypothetical protein HZB08_02460 [Candidatus Saganbacteria bacterium]|uniref:Uncharacterized protein n=1 Tax=Candidatus Saganbacteria bacterium TaxID=2575572 RepID=A0A9D6UK56_UNCSA|nr:hypothetical protein [Candidatus Saganbacteria bacterium]